MARFSHIPFLLFFFGLHAQESAPIIRFTPNDYNAENQNWAVTQDARGFIYVANNEGLMAYDGARWSVYPSPNRSVPRSVLAKDDRIYMGGFMEFGYYEESATGAMRYTSLSQKLDFPLLEDENFWHIKAVDHIMVFQSYDRLYFYDTQTGTTQQLTERNNFYRIFSMGNSLFAHKRDGAIVRFDGGNQAVVAKIPEGYGVRFVMQLFETPAGYRMVTRNQGIFDIRDGAVIPVDLESPELLKNLKIFSAIPLSDGSLMLGTVTQGLLHISAQGQLLHQIDQTNGLNNNTVLSLFEDLEGNVWVAMDNGLACLNMRSYIREFTDKEGALGTVYCAKVYRGDMYLGTNQGLFYKPLNSLEVWKPVSGAKGQVWSLYVYDDVLFCAHTDAILHIIDHQAIRIKAVLGTWGFRQVPNRPDLLLAGHYSGMGILKKENGQWTYGYRIKGFENSARFFEVMDDGDIWVNHEYKGIFRLRPSPDLTSFEQVERVGQIPLGKGSALTKIAGTLYHKYRAGVFRLDEKTATFKRDSLLGQLTPEDAYSSGVLIEDDRDRVWAFNQEDLRYMENTSAPGKKVIKTIPIANSWRKTPVSFENIERLEQDNYLLGITDGYLLVDLKARTTYAHQVHLKKVSLSRKDSVATWENLLEKGGFNAKENTLSFYYSVPRNHKYEDVQFSYILKGFDDQWSPWSKTAKTTFENLPYGDYTFKVRSKIASTPSSNTASYSFEIKRPALLSNLAIALYTLMTLSMIVIVHRSYRNYYRKQHERLSKESERKIAFEKIQAEKELSQLRNAKLNQEIEAKNRELAISMMSVIKRNEVLKGIKKELKQNTDLEEDAKIFKLIKKNQNDQQDWAFFKEAFDNADRDFLKRAKAQHPKLNANDLKFCAYLRLNLSSKEIAPFLSISVKSVEVRRYRLRKKMELDHDVNLTDYILTI